MAGKMNFEQNDKPVKFGSFLSKTNSLPRAYERNLCRGVAKEKIFFTAKCALIKSTSYTREKPHEKIAAFLFLPRGIYTGGISTTY